MQNKDFFVVAIGASAGGLDAIQQLFDNIPDQTGMAFVIVQHLSPNFKSLMPELLSKHTGMKIYTSEDNQVIKPNCIYLNQKSKNLYIKGNRLFLIEKSPKRNLNLPIDIFFHSLAEEYQDKSVGIILSGTGSDGSRGIKSIKEAGGILMVQEPESAQFDGMPNSSIRSGLIDFILPPEKIAETLVRIPNHQISLIEYKEKEKSNRSIYFQILDLIHKRTSIDFKQYKKNSLLRRLEKQMSINNFTKLHDYLDYLKDNPSEIEVLKQDFLIGVTGFFRDKEAFDILRAKVIPRLFDKHKSNKKTEEEETYNVLQANVMPQLFDKHKNDSNTVRVWVSGCSTGEEAYSIAFLLDDYIKKERLNTDFKIFATDINEEALKKAGRALYSVDSAREMPKEYIDSYFIKESGQVRVIKRIRDHIVFSKHNLLKDPPFIRIDLISCRNLLIYIEPSLQSKALRSFQFSLKKEAYLLLGSSETLGHQATFFKPISSKWKIYQCLEDTKRLPMQIMTEERSIESMSFGSIPTPIAPPKLEYRFKQNPEYAFYKYIGQKFGPVMVFTDTDFNILFVNGDITSRLAINEGLFQGNLLKLVNSEVATIIRSGIHKAEQENAEVVITNVINTIGKQNYYFDLKFRKINDFENFNTVYTIHFSEDKQNDTHKRIVINNQEADEISKQRIAELEDELKSSKSQLQYMLEQLETSNEELQSSNEELMASNEELQSTNEELQSVNEELYTVNTELQETNKELYNVNDDVNNLLNATDIGTLFLNVDLRIRKFTPALQKHFNLQDEDVGRSISSFASNFNESDSKSIIEDCKTALEELKIIESQISDHEGQYFLRRISPFITNDKKIDGLVITFVDITQILDIRKKLEDSEKRYKGLIMNTNIGVVVHDEQGKIVFNNPKASDLLGLSEKQMRGKEAIDSYWQFIYEDGTPIPLVDYPVMRIIGSKKILNNSIRGVIRKKDDIVWLMVNGFPVLDINGNVKEVIISFIDITERKTAEEQILKEKRFKEHIAHSSPSGIFIHDLKKDANIFSNQQYTDILGYRVEELNTLSKEEFFELFHPDDKESVRKHVDLVTSGKEYVPIEFRFKHKKGHWIWCYSVDSPFEVNEKGEVISIIGSFIDLSDRKAFENEIQEAKQKAEIANIYKNQFLANMSHEIRTPLNGVIGFADLLNEDTLPASTRKQYVNVIKDSSEQLLSLIDDIIDVSKIEANELSLELGCCNVNKLLKSLEVTFTEIQRQKNKPLIKLKCSIPKKEHLYIQTDPLRLRQAISNLLENAIKYSEKGVVEFGYTLSDKDTISFFVKDEGFGIPKSKLDSIFNRFEQLNTESDIHSEGTGLGLAITKGIVKLLGGKIKVESEVGVGTTFVFTVPLVKISTDVAKKDKDADDLDNKSSDEITLLIADDNPINIIYFKSAFRKYSYHIFYANNGLEAVNTYKKHPEIDIVLMDIRMPVMNGVMAAEKILEINPDAKIIAQTAHAMHNDSQKYLDLGFVDYISKPIEKDSLVNKINDLISEKRKS